MDYGFYIIKIVNDIVSIIVTDSPSNSPENMTPKIDVVEYNNTVLIVPINFKAIKKNSVDIPVPNIDSAKMLGTCIKSTSIGICKPIISEMATAAQINDTICVTRLASNLSPTYLQTAWFVILYFFVFRNLLVHFVDKTIITVHLFMYQNVNCNA